MNERDLFIAAVQIEDPAGRCAYLDKACEGDTGVRRRVEALLAALGQAGSFLQQPAADAAATSDAPPAGPSLKSDRAEGLGTVIGPYKLLQQIGEGGMGTVFMAEQTHPVQRKVALKLIKAGMDSRQVIARFEAERQALAMMDHVNIARVLDAGATESGRPYFVMELVHGVPITKYCDDNRLTPRERLALFVPVCQAIQHAHQKGIIHRDVKPSNVMVTLYDGKPVPKVIDFGVAKATEQRLTERTLFTQYGTMVGTLEYMSPEQAEMSALGVDTRSDIYSLGVLLYELLTGSTPLTHKRMKEAAYAEILRMIKEEEPPKPSTRLSDSGEALASISANRHMEPAKLSKLMRGELDWIVMKCLEKDRGRRYETANGFVADVQRYLNDETVQACPPSPGYRFRKFARRNKQALAVAGLVLFFIVLLGGGAGWVLRDRSARLATTERESETALTEAVQLAGQGKWSEALAWVQRAEGVLAHGTASEEFQRRVQDLRLDLEMVAKLEEIRLQGAEVKDDHFDAERTKPAYARAFREYGIDVNALDPEEAARRIRARTIPVELATALDDWISVPRMGGNDNEAPHLRAVARLADPDPFRNRLRHAWQLSDRKALEELAASDQTSRMSPRTLALLGGALGLAGAIEQQVTLLRQAQQRHPDDFWINTSLGLCLTEAIDPARPQEAVRFFTVAVALRPQSPGAHYNLGVPLSKAGSHAEAIAAYREAIRLKPDYAHAHNALGSSLLNQKKLDEAIAAYRKAIRLKPDYAHAYFNLGVAFRKSGSDEQAIAAYREAVRLKPDFVKAYYNLGFTLSEQGKLADAIAAYRKAIEFDSRNAPSYKGVGNALSAQKKLDDAIAAYRKAIDLDPKDATLHFNLSLALGAQGNVKEAIAACREAIKLDPKLAIAHKGLGTALKAQGNVKEAVAAFREAIRLDPNDAEAHRFLGGTLKAQRNVNEAVAAYQEAIRLDPNNVAGQNNLGAILCDYLHDYDKAIACFTRAIELDPAGAQAYKNRGIALSRKGLVDDGVKDIRTALQLKPDYPEGYISLGDVLGEKGDLAGSIAAYREAIRLAPNDAKSHNNLGLVLLRKGSADEAIAEYRAALRLNPNLAEPRVNLGGALLVRGLAEEAVAECREVIRRNPDFAPAYAVLGRAYDTLGRAAYQKGLWEEAISQFGKAAKVAPKSAGPHTWLGIALSKAGRPDEAIAAYKEAIRLDPKNAQAYERLAFLLATHPEPKRRDPAQSLLLAKKAVELMPAERLCWQTLAWAQYRAGDWKTAIAAMEKVKELGSAGDSREWFLLAMAHWQQGNKVEASKWYDQAVAWMDKNESKDEELRRFQVEASELMGIKQKKE